MKGPRRLDAYPDRLLDCEEALEDELAALIGRACAAGWSRPETLAALISLCENTQLGDDADPILSALIGRGAGGNRS
ncbi:hypothetical protein [Paracoccus sp. KR1-242]|uniref:hypothetical protein n=1 Tax=Paracoccus sp. KR1-242 TaxID=3410028 RepID=UPI003C047327